MVEKGLVEENLKLIEKFGAGYVSELADLPDLYTFNNGLMYSHREFDQFYKELKKGTKSAIVSGFNASASMHVGHMSVFDTNLFFQKELGAKMFIPISDDESYVSLKVKTQEEALKNSLVLARMMLAYGFDLKNTNIIIDQLYTNIYNLAIKLSRGITLSEIRAVYGHTPDQNVGLHFYPSVQSAHVLLPQEHGIKNILVPIGPDEDAHLRVCRDLADKFGYKKPAVLHTVFLPGLDGSKMSKSKNNAVFLLETEKEIKKKIMSAFSGCQSSIEEHRKLGGNPDVDISYIYLKSYFLNKDEAKDLYDSYKKGRILSGEIKTLLFDKIMERIIKFQTKYEKITVKDLEKVILRNENVDLEKLCNNFNIF